MIKAFFDDDGSVVSQSYTLRAFQDDKDLLNDIKILLSSVGIDSNSVKSYMKSNKIRYYFNITKRKNFATYYNLMGFTSVKKQNRLKLLAYGR